MDDRVLLDIQSRMEMGSSSSASESVNGLKFGKKIYFEDVGGSGLEGNGGGGSGSPAKKGRSGVAHGGGQAARCQVEGCMVDLSDAKAYYSRHKVCGMHSKSSKVIVAGIEQRFCQQCSRFHKLPEFDQGKRSCRRRLACHNERRRKPPQGSILSSHFGSLSPTTTTLSPNMFDNQRKTGGFLMDFTAFSTPPGRESWHNTTPERGFGNNQLPCQTNLQNHLPNLLQSPTIRPSYSSPGVSSVDCFVSDSNSALSLLSIQPPWGSRTRPSSLNGFLGTNTNANGTTLIHPSVNPIGQFNCPPDMGLGQINGQYNTGELGLAQRSDGRFHDLDHSRGYDSFV